MFSSQLWTLSARAIIPAILFRITARDAKGLPNALRWLIHLRTVRIDHTLVEVKTYLSITNIPPPSSPSVFSTGTFTSSNVMYAVPAVGE
ncbi:hypothetical protein PHLCEN_2v11200 [Hermanssonia centrifuga]|uniref:Uncharacterized protein n=1 Tax=Hermanssonia centrifuga TaxID=98765 RepID=A0A2R6NKS8_9APHY|nr:hypothetical protein PHLCEN_2v11200 [Hermanssonia centrifuga]